MTNRETRTVKRSCISGEEVKVRGMSTHSFLSPALHAVWKSDLNHLNVTNPSVAATQIF